jgi:hypothetical protein
MFPSQIGRGLGLVLTGLALGGLALSTDAADDPFRHSIDHPDLPRSTKRQPFQENAVPLPPYPADEDLRAVEIRLPERDLRVAVDAASLSVSKQGVLRYVMVIESARGARNVLFEGLRCAGDRYKTYGYGTSDGRMVALERVEWRPLSDDPSGIRERLARYYLCDATHNTTSVRAIRRVLRGGSQEFEDLFD